LWLLLNHHRLLLALLLHHRLLCLMISLVRLLSRLLRLRLVLNRMLRRRRLAQLLWLLPLVLWRLLHKLIVWNWPLQHRLHRLRLLLLLLWQRRVLQRQLGLPEQRCLNGRRRAILRWLRRKILRVCLRGIRRNGVCTIVAAVPDGPQACSASRGLMVEVFIV